MFLAFVMITSLFSINNNCIASESSDTLPRLEEQGIRALRELQDHIYGVESGGMSSSMFAHSVRAVLDDLSQANKIAYSVGGLLSGNNHQRLQTIISPDSTDFAIANEGIVRTGGDLGKVRAALDAARKLAEVREKHEEALKEFSEALRNASSASAELSREYEKANNNMQASSVASSPKQSKTVKFADNQP